MGVEDNIYLVLMSTIITTIICTIFIVIMLAVISSNIRKQNKFLKQNKESLEHIMMTQDAIFIELQKQQYGQYPQMNQQQHPYQYQQNRGRENEQVYNNPYMK